MSHSTSSEPIERGWDEPWYRVRLADFQASFLPSDGEDLEEVCNVDVFVTLKDVRGHAIPHSQLLEHHEIPHPHGHHSPWGCRWRRATQAAWILPVPACHLGGDGQDPANAVGVRRPGVRRRQ